MKNLVLRYGLYAALIILGFNLLQFFLIDLESLNNYGLGEIIGYSIIILSLVFVFLGIKKYRDENNGGAISFWEALKVGILIALIPAIAFGLYNVFYTQVLDPEFMDNYFQHYLDEMQATMSATEFEEKKAELVAEQAMFQKPIVQFGAMSLTVLIVGFIVSLVSSMVLKKGEKTGQNVLDA